MRLADEIWESAGANGQCVLVLAFALFLMWACAMLCVVMTLLFPSAGGA